MLYVIKDTIKKVKKSLFTNNQSDLFCEVDRLTH